MAHGPDNILGRMRELCGENLTLSLSIVSSNNIKTGIFPTLWKSANVTLTHRQRQQGNSIN